MIFLNNIFHAFIHTVSAGANANVAVSVDGLSGLTPLIAAVETGNPEIVSLLLANKITNIDFPDEPARLSCTALHYAAYLGHVDIVRMLLKKKANVDARNDNGATPLMLATLRGHTAIVELLCAFNANTDISEDDQLVTPLMVACFKGNVDIAKILLTKGASVNLVNKHGATALVTAAASQNINPDIIQLLLDSKANVDIRDGSGLTALQFAMKSGNLRAIALLSGAQLEYVKRNSKPGVMK